MKSNEEPHKEDVVEQKLSPFGKILSKLKRKYLSDLEVVLFGFALVLGNRNITWNKSLVNGFDSYLFNLLFVGSAYICLCLCMSEMISALPFSGGIFGFVRAAAGPYFGYVTAWFEIAFILTYIVIKVDQVIALMIALNVFTADFHPYAVVIFYATSFVWNVVGGKPFWSLVCLLGAGTFFLYLIYLGGVADASLNLKTIDYRTFCETAIPFTFDNMMPGRTNINGFYQGLHFIPLLSDTLKRPREQIPRALIICSVTFVVLSVFLSLSACSQFPGITKLAKAKYPLQYGFSNVFNVSLLDSIWFNAPGMYAVALCLFFCAGKQIYAISKSGLLFAAFSVTTPVLGTPYLSYLAAAVIGTGLNIYVYFYNVEGYAEVRNVAVLASHVVFFLAFVTYILFKVYYSSLTRSFTSPLGIWGAIYGLGNYLIGIISIVHYSGNTYFSLYALCCLFGAVTAFFWLYMVRYQNFSEEEKKLMFKAYLINANREKRRKVLQKGNKGNNNQRRGSNSKSKAGSVSQVNRSIVPEYDEPSDLFAQPEVPAEPQVAVLTEEEQQLKNSGDNTNLSGKDHGSVRFASHVSTRSNTLQATSTPSLLPYQPQPSSRQSFSAKLTHFLLSAKMNSVAPLTGESMKANSRSIKVDQQMLIVAAGGILDQASEKALKEELGFDIEASEEINLSTLEERSP